MGLHDVLSEDPASDPGFCFTSLNRLLLFGRPFLLLFFLLCPFSCAQMRLDFNHGLDTDIRSKHDACRPAKRFAEFHFFALSVIENLVEAFFCPRARNNTNCDARDNFADRAKLVPIHFRFS
ncbi:hypothetical protein HDG34_003358 [Paraburkholderia sp. HC6.4b]|nr:hypothetical protein [Paraburkholderia sp. HC6.4b]